MRLISLNPDFPNLPNTNSSFAAPIAGKTQPGILGLQRPVKWVL
jgi:hypothetical protein